MSARVRELSPRGRGGVSVLSIEGPGALERARALLPGLELDPAPRLRRLQLGDSAADEVLALALSPERVELHVHGSPALVRELLAALAPADEPERADGGQRALAAALLARAASEAGARILLDQAEGALGRELERLAQEAPAPRRRGLAELAWRSRVAWRAIEPATVVLAGPVNAGKSTLFNALVGARRASVSEEPGTTRDALVERALLGRYPVELVDTAGERALGSEAPAEVVERAAQELGRELAAGAALVFWLQPPEGPPPPVGARVVRLRSRASREDLARGVPAAIAALEEPEAARALVTARFLEQLELPGDPWQPGRGVALGGEARARLERLVEEGQGAALAQLRSWAARERR